MHRIFGRIIWPFLDPLLSGRIPVLDITSRISGQIWGSVVINKNRYPATMDIGSDTRYLAFRFANNPASRIFGKIGIRCILHPYLRMTLTLKHLKFSCLTSRSQFGWLLDNLCLSNYNSVSRIFCYWLVTPVCSVIVALFMSIPMLMDPMVLSILYVWCQLNKVNTQLSRSTFKVLHFLV